MNAGTEHILTAGEQKLRATAQEQLAAAGNLLNEPLRTNDVHDALRSARAATATLEYLERQVASAPPLTAGMILNRR